MAEATVEYRRALAREEVPLPPGGDFSLDVLEPEWKAKQRAIHADRVRVVKEQRLLLYERAKEDKEFRKFVYEKCRRDLRYFIEMFLWTYDDRVNVDEPFVLYDFQRIKIVEPYLRFIEVQAPSRVTYGYAKSRGVGLTWVALACRVWRFIFADNWSILIGTENRDDLDDGGINATHQTMLGKVRYMIDKLPPWMRDDLLGPQLYNDNYNKRWHLANPMKPRNVIHAKQLGDMFGRSRRYSEAFADEVAWAEEMKNADTSIKQTTNRFMFGSTPKGMGNFFHAAMHGMLPGVQKFWMWWAEHPLLDLKWYNSQREHMTDDQIAQELDISFTMSAGRRVLNEVTAAHFVKIDGKPFLYDERLELEVLIDPGFADALACIWVQWDEIENKGRIVDFVQVERKAVDWIVPFINGAVPEQTYAGEKWKHEYNDTEKEIIARHARWSAPSCVWGDAAGGAKTWTTGTSAWDELHRYGILVNEIKITNDEEALKRLELFMRHVRIAVELMTQRNGPKINTPTLGEVVTQWRYPQQRENAMMPKIKPIHDLYCHGGDCMKMWAQTRDLPDATSQPAASGRILARQGRDIEYPNCGSPFG